jgi:hypothetical protein
MAFKIYWPHCLKQRHQIFSNLSLSNALPINAHTKVDTCHRSMLSPNNFKLKPIIILGKSNTFIQWLDENLQKGKKLFGD